MISVRCFGSSGLERVGSRDDVSCAREQHSGIFVGETCLRLPCGVMHSCEDKRTCMCAAVYSLIPSAEHTVWAVRYEPPLRHFVARVIRSTNILPWPLSHASFYVGYELPLFPSGPRKVSSFSGSHPRYSLSTALSSKIHASLELRQVSLFLRQARRQRQPQSVVRVDQQIPLRYATAAQIICACEFLVVER